MAKPSQMQDVISACSQHRLCSLFAKQRGACHSIEFDGRGDEARACSSPMRSWMALCERPMRQKMLPNISADDTLEAARAILVARSRVICRLHNAFQVYTCQKSQAREKG